MNEYQRENLLSYDIMKLEELTKYIDKNKLNGPNLKLMRMKLE